MEIKVFKGKALIVAIWIIFMLVSAFVFYEVEEGLYTNKAKGELVEQAENISKQIPSIIENDMYSDIGGLKVLMSKLKAAAFKLQDFDTIEQAKPFLDDFTSVAGIDGLVVVDRSGNLLYGPESEFVKLNYSVEEIEAILDQRLYKSVSDKLDDLSGLSNYMQKAYLSEGCMDISGKAYSWGVGDHWLIAITNDESSAQQEVMEHFDWSKALQKITIGNSGSLIAVRTRDGEILSCADEKLVGETIGSIGMNVSGFGWISSVEDLQSAFTDAYKVKTVKVGGVDKLATRLDIDDEVILALLPVSEVTADALGATLLTELLIGLTSGLFILYALLHAGFEPGFEVDGKNKVLSDKLVVAGILVICSVFLFNTYLNSLSSYSYKFRYCKTKVNSVAQFMEENENAKDELQNWFDGEYLTRARMVKCILNHTERGAVTRGYIDNLSRNMDIRYLYLFNGDGELLLTNSRYDKIKIDSESPFYALLEGRMEVVTAPEYKVLMGETLETVGISMTDEQGDGDGVLLTMTNPLEPQTIGSNLGYMSAFRQVSLTEDSCIMAIDSNTMDICYMATIVNGGYVIGDGSFDYKGTNISVLGMDEGKITDNFNGNIIVNKRLYFASVKRSGEHFFVVMKPQLTIDFIRLVSVSIAVSLSTAFVAAVILVFRKRKNLFKDARVIPVGTARTKAVFSSFEDEVELLMGNMQRRNPLFFESRWPEDCRRWKDKAPGQKFAILSRYVLILTIATILVQSQIATTNSIWYYCVNGEWDNGVNLYSITRCLMAIGILVVAKLVIHKLLFWIARTSRSKGETLCSLLDHFNVYILSIIGVFLCLSYFGVNTKALTLTGGAVGVIFGIGCQTIVADILAGLIMTLEGVVHNGDMVMFDGKPEIIQSIGVRTIRLKWQEGIKTVRNNEFRNHITLSSDRIDIITAELSVDWSMPIEQIEKVLEKELPSIGDKLREISKDSSIVGPKFKGIKQLEKDAVVLSFVILCHHMTAKEINPVFNKELKLMCERNNINPPVPEINVIQN